MKMIIAPSKTMHKTAQKGTTFPLFQPQQETLLQTLQHMDEKALLSLFNIKDKKIAQLNYARFQDFKEDNHALFAYSGHQFKFLDAKNLDEESLHYLDQRLYIMSGLYGLIRPSDSIGLYRLPMGLKLNNEPLKYNWIKPLSDYLVGETVLNLASKEYSDALDKKRVHVVDVDFYPDQTLKRKVPAMEAKKLRGLMVRHMALNRVKTLEGIKRLSFNDYRYLANVSNPKRLVFVKR